MRLDPVVVAMSTAPLLPQVPSQIGAAYVLGA
jgi:hypothetical protein